MDYLSKDHLSKNPDYWEVQQFSLNGQQIQDI